MADWLAGWLDVVPGFSNPPTHAAQLRDPRVFLVPAPASQSLIMESSMVPAHEGESHPGE